MLGAQNSLRPGQSVYCGLALEEEVVVLDIAEDVFRSSIKLGWKNQSVLILDQPVSLLQSMACFL